tara:strand:+ start:508 stop:669 length:162 start_codon:yes stop_codon:yes gene_type:complete
MPINNFELLKSIEQQVRKEMSIPADCNDNNILFDVMQEVMTRYVDEINSKVKS